MTKAARSALETAYRSLITQKRLQENPHQAQLISRLATLQHELIETNHASLLPRQLNPKGQNGVRGLYIYGSVGTGKSRLADLFTSTLPSNISKRRVHFYDFMNDVHQRLHTARSLPGDHIDPLVAIGRKIRQESRVLCFDEFQVTDIADAMILGRLFGSIWNEGGVMMSTSNRHPDSLYERGLNRDVVVPFLRELQRRCEVWRIGGEEDYRMRSLREGGGDRVETFLTDREAFDERLAGALGGQELERVSLFVFGTREMSVMAAPDPTVTGDDGRRLRLISASFNELCKANLAAQDYYAVCSSTSTIFLSGLEPFQRTAKDPVRRFITLIDVAYEKGTRVICHSSVPLSELFADIVEVDQQKKISMAMSVKGQGGASSSMMSTFLGETEWSATGLSEASLATGGAGDADVAFAVGRAISRLYEMGSVEYGHFRE